MRLCDCFEIIPTYFKKTSLSLTYFGTNPFLNIFYFKPHYLFKIIFPPCNRCLELLSLYLTFFQDEFRLFLLKNCLQFSTAILALYDAILTFKCLKGLAPKYLSSRFNTRASVHGRNTRNRNKLDIPVFNAAAGQRSFIYRAVKCWNSLPEEITKCEDLCSFKSKAKSYFFTVFA